MNIPISLEKQSNTPIERERKNKMSVITEEIRAAASEMYRGDEICQEKSKFLLTEMGLPNGLLPLRDIEEVGYIKDTGFVWLIQKKKFDHKFEKIGRHVQYGAEVTAYVEQKKIKKLTGVKAKEMMIWLSICDIYIDDPPTGKITFKSPTGFSRSFPIDAFVVQDNKPPIKDAVNLAAKADAVQVKEL
ncbi:uncharacterized protein LOC125193142 [Salvia hispanica]|uniref:uncharacterized protein LOC125193142 n=1 Tax=Salvia hispanica TaxID=49212 RepID=UPI002009D0B8|nr:uncharacterized protein LOC125193142 [Salvia hispanica]